MLGINTIIKEDIEKRFFAFLEQIHDSENIDLIKTKIMVEGVLATCICYDGSFMNDDYEHYQPASSSLDPNHSVAIIGWDDDRVVQGAPGNGAWLTKNSWGAGWGNNGYFWISYYDKHACQNPEMGAISFQDPEAILHEKLATLLVEEFVLLFDFKPKAGTCKRYEISKLKELNMKKE